MESPSDPTSWAAAVPSPPWPPVHVTRATRRRVRVRPGPVRRTLRLLTITLRRKARRR